MDEFDKFTEDSRESFKFSVIWFSICATAICALVRNWYIFFWILQVQPNKLNLEGMGESILERDIKKIFSINAFYFLFELIISPLTEHRWSEEREK